MRATGIVRRVDDLGRVVIPKEIRRSMKIKEGDPLEIYVEGNTVIFCRYNPIDEEKWEGAKKVLRHLLIFDFALADRDKDIKTVSGKKYTAYENIVAILDGADEIGYILAPAGEYTAEELVTASKVAQEILLS